jgi:hypothetical protein
VRVCGRDPDGRGAASATGIIAERSAAAEQIFLQKMGKDTNLMVARCARLMTNQAIERAFRHARPRKPWRASSAGHCSPACAIEHRITHLYFSGIDLVNFYRVHSPGEFGDEIDRMTMLKARDNAAAASGLELGPLGTLTLRLVTPWRRDGEVFGYLEIGEEIEHLIDELRDSLAVDMAVLVDKKFLRRNNGSAGSA